MSTKDVFDYFQEYMPSSIEWIDDVSCKWNTCHCYYQPCCLHIEETALERDCVIILSALADSVLVYAFKFESFMIF